MILTSLKTCSCFVNTRDKLKHEAKQIHFLIHRECIYVLSDDLKKLKVPWKSYLHEAWKPIVLRTLKCTHRKLVFHLDNALRDYFLMPFRHEEVQQEPTLVLTSHVPGC